MSESSLPEYGGLIGNDVIKQFKTYMDQILVDLGRQIILNMPPSRQDCPNCGYDSIRKRSNNRYNNNNPNPLGPLHKEFADGQRCPVCNGQGILNTTRSVNYTAAISKTIKEREIEDHDIGTFNPNMVKTTTILSSFSDILSCVSASIDGQSYKLIGKPIKAGLRDLIRVKAYWELI